MASCCTITYVVVAGIAAVLAIVACSVPLFVITDDNGNYDDAKQSSDFLAGGHVGKFGAPTKASGRTLRREAKAQSITKLQCPLFGGQCTGSYLEDFPAITTQETLRMFGCDGQLDPVRAFAVIAVIGASAATLLAAVGISRMQGSRVRLYKFGCVFLGGIGWVCGAVGFQVQLSIRRCLEDSFDFVYNYNGDYMIMESAVVTAIFTGVLLICTFSMLSSWWCRCCGDQPGRYYVNYVPGCQQAARIQQRVTYGEPLMAAQWFPYPGQQPVTGSPIGFPHPVQQYAPAPGATGTYGQPTQQYGYQQQQQQTQPPQQCEYQPQ